MEEEGEDVVEGWCSLHPGMLWMGGVPYIHNVTNHYFTVQRWGDGGREEVQFSFRAHQ